MVDMLDLSPLGVGVAMPASARCSCLITQILLAKWKERGELRSVGLTTSTWLVP